MRLEQNMVENPFYDRPKKVLGMGECVGDEDRMFRRTLGPALSEEVTGDSGGWLGRGRGIEEEEGF